MNDIVYKKDTILDIEDRNAEIRALLHTGICEVTFTKVDGSIRVMPCTLAENLLPPAPVTENKKPRPQKPDTIGVFCTDKKEWRSFRVANVQQVKKLS